MENIEELPVIAVNQQIVLNAPYVDEFIIKLLETTEGKRFLSDALNKSGFFDNSIDALVAERIETTVSLKIQAAKRIISGALKTAGVFDNSIDDKLNQFMLLYFP